MAYRDTDHPRDELVSFRTTSPVDSRISNLAERIKKVKYKFHYKSPMRRCGSKSGIIHHVLGGDIEMTKLIDEINRVEAQNGQ